MAKALSINIDPVPADLTVRADKDRLTQIVLNLLTNAIKFTEPGGLIALSAEHVPRGVALRVSDTGRGIRADRIDSIFSPFVQGGQAGEERQGVGLGLAIGRELARMMGGDLSATSEEGRGSTFVLTLPTAEPLRVAHADVSTAVA
jgi:signal transduction histidine kinase